MKKNNIVKCLLSIVLALSLLFTSLVYSPRAVSDPFDETGMVDEAIAIGMWESFVNSLGLFFEHEPAFVYIDVAGNNSIGIRQAIATIVLSHEIGSVSNLGDFLLGESYPQQDVDSFVAEWTITFAHTPLSEIHQMLTMDDLAALGMIADLLRSGLSLTSDLEDMIMSTMAYYGGAAEGIGQDIIDTLLNILNQLPPQEQGAFWATILAVIDLATHAIPWVLVSYLKNMAAINELPVSPPPQPPHCFR